MKCFWILILISISFVSNAQTSKLRYVGPNKGRDSITLILSQDGIAIDSLKTPNRLDRALFDSLGAGYYELEIIRQRAKENHIFHSLYIGKDSTLIIDDDYDKSYRYTGDKQNCTTRDCKDYENELKLGYGLPRWSSSSSFNHFEIGLSRKSYYFSNNTETMQLGAQFGSYIDYTDIDMNLRNVDRLNYFNAGFEIGGQARWSIAQKHPCKCRYTFISLGATYKLPFFSRFTLTNDNYKTSERYQHTLTNISGYLQVGFRPFSGYVQVRPFNAINKNLTQPSKLTLGIKLNYSDWFK